MKIPNRHILLALALAALLSGCAVYPAVQVAGGAMTGYDAVVIANDYIPRQSVNGGSLCANQDRMLQRRLRERLRLGGINTVSAHVIDSNAYMVGQVTDRHRAEKAVQVARSVTGLRTITVKFFPVTPEGKIQSDLVLLKELSQRLARTERLKRADLRVEVIQGNAILIGRADDYAQKTEAVAIAHEVGGVREVVDYICVVKAVSSAGGRRVAVK
jgi:osmotically-inducible protein OsmY